MSRKILFVLFSDDAAGACGRASSGCASVDPKRKVAELAEAAGVQLLSDLGGHAGIEPFVREGYELVML